MIIRPCLLPPPVVASPHGRSSAYRILLFVDDEDRRGLRLSVSLVSISCVGRLIALRKRQKARPDPTDDPTESYMKARTKPKMNLREIAREDSSVATKSRNLRLRIRRAPCSVGDAWVLDDVSSRHASFWVLSTDRVIRASESQRSWRRLPTLCR